MKIEILYPELTNIYGDLANVRYLEECLPKANFIKTSINEEPYFVNHKVSMIYIGSMPDEYQDIILKELGKYKKRLIELIKNDVLVIATGSAFELFGKYILEDGKKTKGLGVFDNYFVRDKNKRHNSLFIGNYKDMKIVGNKSQFTYMYGDIKHPFITAREGCFGVNENSNIEGICYHHFFGTYLLGPFLILNPYFTKYVLGLIGYNGKLKYEDDVVKAYDKRVKSLERKNARYILHDHG